MMRALLIESDETLVGDLTATMTGGGFSVDHALDADAALNCLICNRYDILVLNHAICDLGGQRLYDRFRLAGLSTPILLLVESGAEVNEGAIADVTKDALLPRSVDAQELIDWSKALIDFTNIFVGFMDFPTIVRQEWRRTGENKNEKDAKQIDLTLAEKKLLGFLLKNRGKTVYKSEILESVWESEEAEVFTNIVEVYITRLRRKLGDHGKKLLTIRGVGYRFEI